MPANALSLEHFWGNHPVFGIGHCVGNHLHQLLQIVAPILPGKDACQYKTCSIRLNKIARIVATLTIIALILIYH